MFSAAFRAGASSAIRRMVGVGLSRLLLMPETGSHEDGVLHLGEIYNLRLNADLVVFYGELLGGRPKAQALRAAKLRTMGRNPEYAKPYYWSSLVLVGQ